MLGRLTESYIAVGVLYICVNISERKRWTKQMEKLEKRESTQAHIYNETTVTSAHDGMHTKAPSSIFVTTKVRIWFCNRGYL